jgi:hypothetical protein
VVRRVLVVTVGQMRMMCCRFVPSCFVVLCGFLVMPGRVFVVFCCLVVMLCCLLRHCSPSHPSLRRTQPGDSSVQTGLILALDCYSWVTTA